MKINLDEPFESLIVESKADQINIFTAADNKIRITGWRRLSNGDEE